MGDAPPRSPYLSSRNVLVPCPTFISALESLPALPSPSPDLGACGPARWPASWVGSEPAKQATLGADSVDDIGESPLQARRVLRFRISFSPN